MILVFGGAYQGKLDYALERFGLTENDIYRCSDETTAMPESSAIIYELDKWILALLKTDIDTDDAVDRFIERNTTAIVISNDISCGIVPEDALMRKWREAVGRALAKIARGSDEVIRLFCGIPTRLSQ